MKLCETAAARCWAPTCSGKDSGAEILIDGEFHGPSASILKLTATSHRLQFLFLGYHTFSQARNLVAGTGLSTVRAVLEKKWLVPGSRRLSFMNSPMLSTIAEISFALLLGVGVPVLAYITARRPEIYQIPRRALYLSAVISQWILALVGALVVLVTGRGFAGAGFRRLPFAEFLRWTSLLVIVALAALAIWLLLEHVGWWPEESDLVRLLMPETAREKVWAVLLVAPTAAVCEEFLYRGFLLAQLSEWLDSGW